MIETRSLSTATKSHYEDLIGQIGNEYIDYRWNNHPVSRSHYRHTKKSVEFAFDLLGGPVDHLLEIGSGPGTWTDICLNHTRKMTIVDISNEMLKLVRDRFKDRPIELICGDYISDEVSLPEEVDVVFSARALEYMDNKRAMVEKSSMILKNKGLLVIITKNPRWMDKKKDDLKDGCSSENYIHSDWIDRHELESYYREYGLVNVVTHPVCFGSYYSPLKSYLGIKLCDLIQPSMCKRKINPSIDFMVESYMTIGQKV